MYNIHSTWETLFFQIEKFWALPNHHQNMPDHFYTVLIQEKPTSTFFLHYYTSKSSNNLPPLGTVTDETHSPQRMEDNDIGIIIFHVN